MEDEDMTGWDTEVRLHNGTALTELEAVFDVGLPEDTVDEVDTTHYKSPGKRREFMAGLIDGGEIQIQMNYRPGSDTDVLLTAAKAARNIRTWDITIPDGETGWRFAGSAFVKSYTKTNPLDGKRVATAVLRVSGAVAEAAATA